MCAIFVSICKYVCVYVCMCICLCFKRGMYVCCYAHNHNHWATGQKLSCTNNSIHMALIGKEKNPTEEVLLAVIPYHPYQIGNLF